MSDCRHEKFILNTLWTGDYLLRSAGKMSMFERLMKFVFPENVTMPVGTVNWLGLTQVGYVGFGFSFHSNDGIAPVCRV